MIGRGVCARAWCAAVLALGLCGAAPRLMLGALGGVLVDRYDRKRLLILIEFASAVPVLIFLVLYTFGALEFWHLLAFEILFGSIRAVNPSASQSILAELVPRDHLMNAVSLYTIGFNFARIVGPSLGGILILWIGVGGCYSVFAASLILAGVGLLLIRLKDERVANPEQYVKCAPAQRQPRRARRIVIWRGET